MAVISSPATSHGRREPRDRKKFFQSRIFRSRMGTCARRSRKKRTPALQSLWATIPRDMQKMLKAALDRRHEGCVGKRFERHRHDQILVSTLLRSC